jgi:hypothetical protein
MSGSELVAGFGENPMNDKTVMSGTSPAMTN